MAIHKLIEKQKAMWDIKHRLEANTQVPGRHVEGGISYGPCLLISRQFGAGGTSVAQLAGEHLGWPVYDREIVDQISEMAHVRQQLVQSVDERVRSSWEAAWREVLFSDDVDCDKYLRYLREVFFTLGHHGDVILLGRGAQYVLPRPSALCVRLIAPVEQRVKRVGELFRMTEPQAQAHLRQREAERSSFIRKFFHADPDAPLSYDLIINTAETGFEGAAEIVLAGLHGKLGVDVSPAKEREVGELAVGV